jgi:uncharacterized membrane protein
MSLALQPLPEGPSMAAWRGALLGLLAYGTCDLTDMATLRHWGVTLAMADIAWGRFASALAATAAYHAMQWRAAV